VPTVVFVKLRSRTFLPLLGWDRGGPVWRPQLRKRHMAGDAIHYSHLLRLMKGVYMRTDTTTQLCFIQFYYLYTRSERDGNSALRISITSLYPLLCPTRLKTQKRDQEYQGPNQIPPDHLPNLADSLTDQGFLVTMVSGSLLPNETMGDQAPDCVEPTTILLQCNLTLL
jgi:hypothetical protein